MSELPTGTVTFLYTDLETSTRLWEQAPGAMREALARHDELLVSTVVAHGGRVIKHTGDGLLSVFGTADEGIAAAVAGQRLLAVEAWGATGPLRSRMALHTGVAEERDGDYFGPVLNRAARLLAVAHPGQVLCSQATAALTLGAPEGGVGYLELGTFHLKDLQRPEVVFQLTHPDLLSDFPPLAAARAARGNLPRQLTSFVGRGDEVVAIAEALADNPVVTLTGVGGVGKTRLAIEVAARLAPEQRDGSWLCALEGVRDGDAVFDAVLDAFGSDPGGGTSASTALIRFLRSKQLVLVLDNCEHLLRPVARLVGEIAHACDEVRVLATSREGLGGAGEHIFVVPSLDVPDANAGAAAIVHCDAVRLFLERARAVRPDFSLDAASATAVAQICAQLDGVPLAIELAAARVGLLTPADLADRLHQRFRVLTGGERGAVERHQTLRAAIDWSYLLLGDPERHLLDRLSVFAGGFTLEAVEAVAADLDGDPGDVLELLAGLVAKSLVVADTQGTHARYRLLETIRQYAEQRLEERGETTATRDAHARYFADLAEAAIAGWRSPQAPEWILRVAPESDNIRAALGWAIDTEQSGIVRRFYAPGVTLGLSEVARIVLPVAPSALGVPGVAGDGRLPIVLACAAIEACGHGEFELVERFVAEALAAQERLDEIFPDVIEARSRAALMDGRFSDHQEFQQEAIGLFRESRNRESLAVALVDLAMAKALRDDDIEGAIAEVDEALFLAERIAAPTMRVRVEAASAFVLADVQPERARTLMDDTIRHWAQVSGGTDPVHSMLGDVAERLGDHRRALEYFVLGIDEHHWLGQTEMVGRMLRRIGLALVPYDPEDAAVLVGASMTRTQASSLTERVNRNHRARVAVLGSSLGEERCQDLMRQGAAMDDTEAVRLAHAAAERALENLPPG